MPHVSHEKSGTNYFLFFFRTFSRNYLKFQDIMLTDLFIIPREKMIANMYIPKVKEKDRNLSAR